MWHLAEVPFPFLLHFSFRGTSAKESNLVEDLTAKLKSLENENKELKNQVETLKANLQLPDVQQLQNDINHAVENKIKELQMNVTQKLDKVTRTKN